MFCRCDKAIFDGAVNQAQNTEAWLPKMNIINTDLEPGLLYTGGWFWESLTTTDFSNFQSKDEVISWMVPHLMMQRRVKNSKKSGFFQRLWEVVYK